MKNSSREAALLFNSGYDANIGLFSSIPQRNDVVICDQLVHNSIREGLRLGRQRKTHFFSHNDIQELADILRDERQLDPSCNIFVGVESIYSMDGDAAPVLEILKLCEKFEALLVIDEAHRCVLRPLLE